jgi:methylase of polypeptide subunit release factors
MADTDLQRLRQALHRDFTADAVSQVLGLGGEAALSRADLSGVDRITRGGSATETWVRLFVLGLSVPEAAAVTALHPLSVEAAVSAGLLQIAAEGVQAVLDLRPYSELDGPGWWVISDLGSDVRPGGVDPEHVLGVGAASTTLAQSSIRLPVDRALDVGTGCGVQALHLSRHAGSITATDLSTRALRLAATTAALNGLEWELLHGSLLDPVANREFDQIVCNPPFIVSPGYTPATGGFSYRDSGMAGDSVCEQLIRQAPAHLREGGTAQLLANWIISAGEDWPDRVGGWLAGSGCDAWIWQREVADPGEYVSLWLADAGLQRGTAQWRTLYDSWLDWFDRAGVLAVGMGLVTLKSTRAAAPTVVCEDVPQAVDQPSGPAISAWFARARWLRDTADDGLLATRLVADPGLVLDHRSLLGAEGWELAWSQLRQSSGMRWEVEVDEALASIIAASRGAVDVATLIRLVAAGHEVDPVAVSAELVPVLRDLISRGLLAPAELVDS